MVDIDGNGLTDFYEVKAKNFDLIRTRIFRYSIQAKDRTDVGNTYPGGQGELGGDDTVGYSRLPIVLMHEVGHNLSLDHGGNEGLNCKPNHVSIMNYALVPFGIARRSTDSQAQDTNNDGVIDARILDFSPPRFPGGRGFAPLYGPGDGLDEMALSETRVLDPSDTANSTRFFDQNGDGRDLNLDEQPDWNGGGNAPGTVQADVNSAPDFAGCDSPPEADLSTLLGHDDWSAITLPISINGIVQDLPENDNGVTPVPQEDDPNESDMFENEAKFSTLDLSVTKTVDAELVMAGQPLTYEITVTNQGPNSALEVFIEDELDENVTPVDLPGNCSVVEDGRVSCDLDVIAEGESSTVTLQVMVSPRLPCGQADTVPLVNTVTVRNGEWSDVNPADNTATAESEALCLRYEYAAKFLCGTPDGRVPLLTAPGDYATIVNVHNFQSRDVPFFKKLALAFPPRAQEAGEIHPIGIDELAYDEALKADCDDLRDRLFDGAFPNGFIEGYLVVQSPRRLDVDVVYTAAAEGEVKTIDVERVPERDLRADLAITKTSVVYPIPLLGPDVLSQFGLYAVLYTVEIHNGGSVHAEDVEVADHVALNTGPGTVGVVVVPDVPFEIPEGSALGDIVNTPFPRPRTSP
ncbi:DUF11 domain-containing protein [Breoghania sp. L-A4]|uniref:DUF11 domain-containing protein n=1 Tax=Breoghania sp. L-A4 TaxID=2304600 RepID=UPI000E35BD61|nr:DUF11 domain-containing protein [Breoghania sp. L-A4]AXS40878.1 DUF11 domain-containing protein [Breoghania sp. L-A4]